jgi:hypothetical protein
MIDDCALPFNARKAFRQKPLTLGKTARCLFLVHARTIKRMSTSRCTEQPAADPRTCRGGGVPTYRFFVIFLVFLELGFFVEKQILAITRRCAGSAMILSIAL